MKPDEFYLTSNGKRLAANDVEFVHHNEDRNINCILRQVGGKGGFGSMLRAIGAQIEKTTNREACRDLSGRRLRDINEEKRLRAWLDKQGEREREAEERKKRKIEKLLAVPKHDFKDEEYEEARAKLTEKVSDAFEEGLKQAEEAKLSAPQDNEAPSSSCTASGTKRKAQADSKDKDKKKIKGSLWIDDDLSGSDLDSDESDDEGDTIKKAIQC